MSNSNLQHWIDLGLVAPSTTAADLRRGRLLLPPLRPKPKQRSRKMGPADYLHHMKLFVMAEGFPEPEADFAFHPEREWKLDLAWPGQKIALELHGGINDSRRRGRHIRADGFTEDREKMNEAALLGWIVLEVVCPGKLVCGLKWLAEAFSQRGIDL
jgi:hypothetical protein